MIQVNVQRNLIALEDLLIGIGTTTQNRGTLQDEPITVTMINGSNLPYDGTYSLKQKFDLLSAEIAALPVVVDQDGNLLTGLIDTSAADLSATHAGRIWRKSISGTEADIYYGSQLMFKYNPTDGNIITDATAYIAADIVVTAAFVAADAVVTAAYIAADLVVHNFAIAQDALIVTAFAAADTALFNSVSANYIAADALLNAKIDNRANVVQQANIAASSNVTKTIAMVDGVWAKITVSSNFTIAFTFPSGEVRSIMLEIANGGAYTIDWPTGIQSPGGTIALTAAGTDHVCVYTDGNNNLFASITASDVKVGA